MYAVTLVMAVAVSNLRPYLCSTAHKKVSVKSAEDRENLPRNGSRSEIQEAMITRPLLSNRGMDCEDTA